MVGLAKGSRSPGRSDPGMGSSSRFAPEPGRIRIVYKSLLKKQHNVEVLSISEPLSDNPFGSLIERIIEWMDEYYSIRLSGEVFRGMKENATRGAYQARPPLGYKVVEHGKPPMIVPEEAEIIRMIFNWYANEGIGFFDIARRLNNLGLKTSQGKPFERRSIEYIIQNPSYCGMIRGTEQKTVRTESRIKMNGSSQKDNSRQLLQRNYLMQHRNDSKQPTALPENVPLLHINTGSPDY